MVAAGPSAISAGIVIGGAVATITAVYLASGWIVRTLLKRLGDQDRQIDTLKEGQAMVLNTMPLIERRLVAVERTARKHRKILNTVTWILELQKGEATAPHRLVYANPSDLRASRPPADRIDR